MIKAEQSLSIEAAVEDVWTYVRDMRSWANLLPGCRECLVLDEHNSRWVLKVGTGGLVRTVKVDVHVDEWSGPERVAFSFKLDGDPVEGAGVYSACRKGSRETEVTLGVQVSGSGSLAPMWEAMSRPLLPMLARSFANRLKEEIEKACATSPVRL